MSLAGVLGLTGAPRDLLYKPENSLVTQSKHSLMGATTTNGDGFGVGWYGAFETPGPPGSDARLLASAPAS